MSNANGSSRSKGMESSTLAWIWIHPKFGVDFSMNYSPVVHDVTFRILILLLMFFGLKVKIDMETSFFYGNIEEEIFMECQPG